MNIYDHILSYIIITFLKIFSIFFKMPTGRPYRAALPGGPTGRPPGPPGTGAPQAPQGPGPPGPPGPGTPGPPRARDPRAPHGVSTVVSGDSCNQALNRFFVQVVPSDPN